MHEWEFYESLSKLNTNLNHLKGLSFNNKLNELAELLERFKDSGFSTNSQYFKDNLEHDAFFAKTFNYLTNQQQFNLYQNFKGVFKDFSKSKFASMIFYYASIYNNIELLEIALKDKVDVNYIYKPCLIGSTAFSNLLLNDSTSTNLDHISRFNIKDITITANKLDILKKIILAGGLVDNYMVSHETTPLLLMLSAKKYWPLLEHCEDSHFITSLNLLKIFDQNFDDRKEMINEITKLYKNKYKYTPYLLGPYAHEKPEISEITECIDFLKQGGNHFLHLNEMKKYLEEDPSLSNNQSFIEDFHNCTSNEDDTSSNGSFSCDNKHSPYTTYKFQLNSSSDSDEKQSASFSGQSSSLNELSSEE